MTHSQCRIVNANTSKRYAAQGAKSQSTAPWPELFVPEKLRRLLSTAVHSQYRCGAYCTGHRYGFRPRTAVAELSGRDRAGMWQGSDTRHGLRCRPRVTASAQARRPNGADQGPFVTGVPLGSVRPHVDAQTSRSTIRRTGRLFAPSWPESLHGHRSRCRGSTCRLLRLVDQLHSALLQRSPRPVIARALGDYVEDGRGLITSRHMVGILVVQNKFQPHPRGVWNR